MTGSVEANLALQYVREDCFQQSGITQSLGYLFFVIEQSLISLINQPVIMSIRHCRTKRVDLFREFVSAKLCRRLNATVVSRN